MLGERTLKVFPCSATWENLNKTLGENRKSQISYRKIEDITIRDRDIKTTH